MSTFQDALDTLSALLDNVTGLIDVISAIDLKLDEVKGFITTLQAGAVTQAQLDQLAALAGDAGAKAGAAKVQAESVLAEADALDNP